MSETTNTTKQFLDKVGLDALWNKICSVFASKQELEDLRDDIPEISIITIQMINDVWEDIVEYDDIVLDEGVLNEYKLG
jgi:hypothetical protein